MREVNIYVFCKYTPKNSKPSASRKKGFFSLLPYGTRSSSFFEHKTDVATQSVCVCVCVYMCVELPCFKSFGYILAVELIVYVNMVAQKLRFFVRLQYLINKTSNHNHQIRT